MHKYRPNIVFICLDALCRSHLGAYGYRRPTPNIDHFAKANTLFLNAYSVGTWTPPAICSILTGKYPAVPRKMTVEEHDGYHMRPVEPTNNPLFCHSPKDLHLGCPLIDYSRSAFPNIINALQKEGYRTYIITSSPFLAYFVLGAADDVKVIKDQIPPALAASSASINRSAEQCWEALRRARLKPPFFLYVHVTQPHKPYKPNTQFIQYGNHTDHRKEERYLLENRADNSEQIVQRRDVLSTQLIDDYDDNLASADYYVGRILCALDDIDPKAMTFLFSDHGEHFYTNGKWYFEHPTAIYEEDMLDVSLEVPLVAKVPGWQLQRIDTSVKLIDLFPTVLMELNLTVPPEVDGCHLLKDNGVVKAICSNLGRVAEKNSGSWHLYDVPESPTVKMASSTLTDEERACLKHQMKALGYE